jgi:hypothetical protein
VADTLQSLEPVHIRPDTLLRWACAPGHVSLFFTHPLDTVLLPDFVSQAGAAPLTVEFASPFELALSGWTSPEGAETTTVAVAPAAVHGTRGGRWPAQDTVRLRLPIVPVDSTGDFEIRVDGLPEPADGALNLGLSPLSPQLAACRVELSGTAAAAGRLASGDYLLSLLADSDANGRWKPGWPAPYVPSERLWFPSDTLRVRARFTTEFSLSLVP